MQAKKTKQKKNSMHILLNGFYFVPHITASRYSAWSFIVSIPVSSMPVITLGILTKFSN